MKVIYNSVIPFPGFAYMNLFGVLFGRNECKNQLTRRTYTHESIHSEQYKDLLYIFFLPLYLLEWIIKIPFGWFYKKNLDYLLSNVPYSESLLKTIDIDKSYIVKIDTLSNYSNENKDVDIDNYSNLDFKNSNLIRDSYPIVIVSIFIVIKDALFSQFFF